MTLSLGEKEFVNFIIFWKWEYTRRNNMWEKTFTEQTSKQNQRQNPFSKGFLCQLNIGPYCGWSFTDRPMFYLDATLIIEDILHKSFKYKHPASNADNNMFDVAFKYMEKFLASLYSREIPYDEIQSKLDLEYKNLFNKFDLNYEHGDRLVAVNVTNFNICVFGKWVECERIYAEAFKKATKLKLDNPEYDAESCEQYQEALAKYLYAKIKSERGKIGNWKNNKQRAVGVWLYDYCNEHNCGGPTAFSALRDTNYLSKLGLAKAIEDDRPLERWLAGTKACVEAADVLPLIG